jgi:hypothetical protein
MKNSVFKVTGRHSGLAIVLMFLGTACVPIERIPNRTMGVSNGPDTVFQQPVSELVPELVGAIATGNNGRVGNELVFWEYQLAQANKANFYACIVDEDVNCEARVRAICPAGGDESGRNVVPGNVRHLDCKAIGIAAAGELRPNCEDNEMVDALQVGLMQCR